MSRIPGSLLSLPDVLQQLPVDDLDTSLWDPLKRPRTSPVSSRGSLRSACKQTRLLADLLTTSISLIDSHAPDSFDNDEEQPPPLDGEELAAWHQEAAARSAFLGRLPRLTSLELYGWRSDGALGALLTRYGAATHGRLRRLKLTCGAPLSTLAGCAITLACPRLAHLELHFEERSDAAISGDLFLSLHGLFLTSVHLSGECLMSADALRSLGGLSHLRHLDAAISGVSPALLPSLGALAHLRHCRIGCDDDDTPLALLDVTALFTLTLLTHLELLSVAHDGAWEAANAAAAAGFAATHAGAAPDVAAAASAAAAAAATARLTAAIAPLAALVHLQHLAFSTDFTVDDTILAALRPLTQLTSLQVGRMDLAQTLPGHLPALKRLIIASSHQPAQLLATLLPLLPLSCLEHLVQRVEHCPMGDWRGCLSVDASCVSPDSPNPVDAATQTRALRHVCGLLAGAPRLRPITHASVETNYPGLTLSCGQVAEGLRPLAGQLRSLGLHHMRSLGAESAVLASSFPRLQRLELLGCELTDVSLAALVGRWAGLEELSVTSCGGVSAEGWLALAAARANPLRLCVLPRLDAALVARCQGLQGSLFGRQNLRFHFG